MTSMIQCLEWLLHETWFNRSTSQIRRYDWNGMWQRSEGSWPQWVGMSCLLSFPAHPGQLEKTTKSRLRRNESKALPRALGEAKEFLAWDAAKCMGIQKVISQTPQRKNATPLNTKHNLCLMCVWALKCWRSKEWYWKNVTRCLPCCFSFPLECPVDHHQCLSYHIREVFGTTQHNQPDIMGTTTATARVCSQPEANMR